MNEQSAIDDRVTPPAGRGRPRSLGVWLGPALALATYFLLTGSGLDTAGRGTAAMAVWMATWWMTEAIPIFATGLLPLALFPLAGVRSIRETAMPYGHELIFLFLGGFVVAIAMERWSLHRRIAMTVVRLVGSRAERMVGAFILITAVLSMWISNTATAIMMLPIAISVIHRIGGDPQTALAPAHRAFATCLMLGIAYGASIGGVATLIGTPPNLFLASYAREQLALEIGFAAWMGVALPLVCVLLLVLWLLLTRVLYPCHRLRLPPAPLDESHPGPMSQGERLTLMVFLATAGAWLLRPVLNSVQISGLHPLGGLTDTGIAMLAAVILFVLPAGDGQRVMRWRYMHRVPWGLLILFGGGLSLASAMQANGVSAFIGEQLRGLGGMPPLLVVAAATAIMVFLTELTSNTATTAAMVPIFAAVADGIGLSPVLLATAAAVSASCAFMLPVATPPNAIVFAGGHLRIRDMMRAGIWMNLICVVLVTTWVMLYAAPRLGA